MIIKYKVLESWKPRLQLFYIVCSCAIHTSAILTNAKAKGNMNSCCTCKFLYQKDEKMTPSSEETHLLFHLGLSLSCTNTPPTAHVANGCDASSALCTTDSCKWKVDWCRGGATWRFCIWSKAGQWHRPSISPSGKKNLRSFSSCHCCWLDWQVDLWSFTRHANVPWRMDSGRFFANDAGWGWTVVRHGIMWMKRISTWHFWWVFWCAYCSHWLIPGLDRNCLLHEGVCMRGFAWGGAKGHYMYIRYNQGINIHLECKYYILML